MAAIGGHAVVPLFREGEAYTAPQLRSRRATVSHMRLLVEKGIAFIRKRDLASALRYLEPFARRGDTDAQYALGRLWQDDVVVPKDISRAIHWLGQAATAGNTNAKHALAVAYRDAPSPLKSLAKARFWFNAAASDGNTTSMRGLARLYETGHGVPQSWPKAFELYKKASDLGNREAMCGVAVCYMNGFGTPKDTSLGLILMEDAAARGSAQACFNLSVFHFQGKGVPADAKKSREYLQKAASLGHEEAQVRLTAWDEYDKAEGVDQEARMSQPNTDRLFAGSIPQLYDQYMVPLIFEPYAADIAARVAQRRPNAVLEIAAGTGAVTRHLARELPTTTSIIATDLNQAMIDHARSLGTRRAVDWRQADAMQLPFADESFDVVVCQFGAMFFPDKPKAFSEARRVLRPGGAFIFNVWGRIEDNEFAEVVTAALATMFPDDPPRFMVRTPHGYGDAALITKHLAEAGFSSKPAVTPLAARSRAANADIPATAYCQGTPLSSEIEARAPTRLPEATKLAADALRARFGEGAVDGKIQALIFVAER